MDNFDKLIKDLNNSGYFTGVDVTYRDETTIRIACTIQSTLYVILVKQNTLQFKKSNITRISTSYPVNVIQLLNLYFTAENKRDRASKPNTPNIN
jgi:hypothetical protein